MENFWIRRRKERKAKKLTYGQLDEVIKKAFSKNIKKSKSIIWTP